MLKNVGHSRRINPDRGAMTLITTSGPGGKYTGPIHYDQRRTLTVAERKRLQGVPDDYNLVGSVEDVSPVWTEDAVVDVCRKTNRSVT